MTGNFASTAPFKCLLRVKTCTELFASNRIVSRAGSSLFNSPRLALSGDFCVAPHAFFSVRFESQDRRATEERERHTSCIPHVRLEREAESERRRPKSSSSFLSLPVLKQLSAEAKSREASPESLARLGHRLLVLSADGEVHGAALAAAVELLAATSFSWRNSVREFTLQVQRRSEDAEDGSACFATSRAQLHWLERQRQVLDSLDRSIEGLARESLRRLIEKSERPWYISEVLRTLVCVASAFNHLRFGSQVEERRSFFAATLETLFISKEGLLACETLLDGDSQALDCLLLVEKLLSLCADLNVTRDKSLKAAILCCTRIVQAYHQRQVALLEKASSISSESETEPTQEEQLLASAFYKAVARVLTQTATCPEIEVLREASSLLRLSFARLPRSARKAAALSNSDGALWVSLLNLEDSAGGASQGVLEAWPSLDEALQQGVFWASEEIFMRGLLPPSERIQQTEAMRLVHTEFVKGGASDLASPMAVPEQLKRLSTRALSRVFLAGIFNIEAVEKRRQGLGDADLAELAAFARSALSAASHEAWRCSLRDVLSLIEGLDRLAALEPRKESPSRVAKALVEAGLEERRLRFAASVFFRALRSKLPKQIVKGADEEPRVNQAHGLTNDNKGLYGLSPDKWEAATRLARRLGIADPLPAESKHAICAASQSSPSSLEEKKEKFSSDSRPTLTVQASSSELENCDSSRAVSARSSVSDFERLGVALARLDDEASSSSPRNSPLPGEKVSKPEVKLSRAVPDAKDAALEEVRVLRLLARALGNAGENPVYAQWAISAERRLGELTDESRPAVQTPQLASALDYEEEAPTDSKRDAAKVKRKKPATKGRTRESDSRRLDLDPKPRRGRRKAFISQSQQRLRREMEAFKTSKSREKHVRLRMLDRHTRGM